MAKLLLRMKAKKMYAVRMKTEKTIIPKPTTNRVNPKTKMRNRLKATLPVLMPPKIRTMQKVNLKKENLKTSLKESLAVMIHRTKMVQTETKMMFLVATRVLEIQPTIQTRPIILREEAKEELRHHRPIILREEVEEIRHHRPIIRHPTEMARRETNGHSTKKHFWILQ